MLSIKDVKEDIHPASPHKSISNPILRFLFQSIPESIKTMFRVVQLALIFLPPLLTWPIAFLGKILPGRGIKSGTVWWYNTLVHSMELAGPTFIKLAQWAATRVDIFPPQLCATLARLQSEVKPHSFHETRRIIREQFAADIEDLFVEFSDKPVGVGAIAQVYSARLKSEYAPPEVKKKYGSDEPIVAVKVLHPNVGGQIYRDLRIITFIAKCVHIIPLFSSFNLPDQVTTFGTMMKQQLDLTKEAENIENFRGIWKTRQDVCFPEIIWPYVTEKALIESFEFGVPMKLFLKEGYTTVMDDWLAAMGLDTLLVCNCF
jgi:aarF domain-containing kinase